MDRNNIKKDIVLFGCGSMGYNVLKYIGEENVKCFIDNNPSLHGTERWGKQVISLKQLKQSYDNYIILICIKISKAYQIVSQLNEEGVYDYWVYPKIEFDLTNMTQEKKISFLRDKDLMERARISFYQDKISELNCQLDYMKKHADIKSMKPATGALRDRQIETVSLSGFFCKALEVLGIRAILFAGNLLGYVRHNGFIPWDDDMDFVMLRNDYEKLWEYCITNCDENGIVIFTYNGRNEKLYFNETTFGHMCISNNKLNDKCIFMDIFVLDYYKDDYLFEDLRIEAFRISKNTYEIETIEEKVEYIRKEIKANKFIADKSNFLFWGFDNFFSYSQYNRGKMIPENVVLPLKKIKFEGEDFFVPNDPEEFLTYIYEDIWNFPDDVGLQKHITTSEN